LTSKRTTNTFLLKLNLNFTKSNVILRLSPATRFQLPSSGIQFGKERVLRFCIAFEAMIVSFPGAAGIAATCSIQSAAAGIQVRARVGIYVQHAASCEDELLRGDGDVAGPQTSP
jgi:hypothetical protein